MRGEGIIDREGGREPQSSSQSVAILHFAGLLLLLVAMLVLRTSYREQRPARAVESANRRGRQASTQQSVNRNSLST